MKNFKLTLIGMLVIMIFAVPASAQMTGDQMGQQGSVRVSELMDMTVIGQQGNEIGSVSDILVSREGELEYLIVSEGAAFLGLGEEDLIPIPWDKVQADRITAEDDEITVALDEQTLNEAPTFTDDQWEAFTRGDMDEQVRGFYDTQGQHGQPGMDRDADQQREPMQQRQ
jgi:sporulation protein YlmC with PRC-barrel domain